MERIIRSKKNKIIILVAILIFITTVISVLTVIHINKIKNDKQLAYVNKLINEGDYSKANDYSKKINSDNDKEKIQNNIKEKTEKEEQSYSTGIEMLQNDNTSDYSNSVKYFNDYTNNYHDSENVSKAKKLLDLINEYNQQNSELQTAKENQKGQDLNKQLIDTIQSYEGTIDDFYSQVVSAIGSQSKSELISVYGIWNQNSSTYYSMNSNLEGMKSNISNCVITDDELNKIEEYITNGLVPGECMATYVSTRTLDDSLTSRYMDSYNNYSAYKSAVDSIISSKSEKLSSNIIDISSLQKKVDDLKNQITNYK